MLRHVIYVHVRSVHARSLLRAYMYVGRECIAPDTYAYEKVFKAHSIAWRTQLHLTPARPKNNKHNKNSLLPCEKRGRKQLPLVQGIKRDALTSMLATVVESFASAVLTKTRQQPLKARPLL